MHMSCLVVDRVLMKSLLNTRPPFTTTMAHLSGPWRMGAHGAWGSLALGGGQTIPKWRGNGAL